MSHTSILRSSGHQNQYSIHHFPSEGTAEKMCHKGKVPRILKGGPPSPDGGPHITEQTQLRTDGLGVRGSLGLVKSLLYKSPRT